MSLNNPDFILILTLVSGAVLDTILGDPIWLPHPVRLFGVTIGWLDKALNRGVMRFYKGLIMTLMPVSAVWIIIYLTILTLEPYPVISIIITSIFVFFGLGNKSLIEEGLKVERFIDKGETENARKQLATIVGRDTKQLSPQKMRIAVLETLSENLSDGVVAPLFYFAIGGVPLMMAYKMVNTLDSMVGYKNERYIDFGKASAILDDIANFVPSRLTALMIAICSASKRSFEFIYKFGKAHASPNSGDPEAALAGTLNCRFGGGSYYNDILVDKPFIGINDREINKSDIKRAIYINIRVFILSIAIISLICIW